MSICCKCNSESQVWYFKALHGVIPEEAKIDEFECNKCGNKIEKYRLNLKNDLKSEPKAKIAK